MNGTTLCPHCETRFKIADAQLSAHHGMVRCGHCLQPFDARTTFIPETQLILPIDDEPVEDTPTDQPRTDTPDWPDNRHVATSVHELPHTADFHHTLTAEHTDNTLDFSAMTAHHTVPVELDDEEDNKFYMAEPHAPQHGEDSFPAPVKRRSWLWALGAIAAVLLLSAQSAYFFRISLAAHLPAIKPALVGYCQLLNCSVPLPENADLTSIESSSLDADPAHDNQITLNALLRSRAGYALAFPVLGLTLNDSNDKPLARRLLLPADYLPSDESESAGFPPNHEISIKLRLDTGDLKATGYRLELFYPH